MLPLKLREEQMASFRMKFGEKKVFAQCLMPVRGTVGFRKLDYEYPKDKLNPTEVINKIADCGFNCFALVVKDTDGACLSKTKVGWNPVGRDLVQEFQDECKRHNLKFFLSFTDMNDAYQGWLHPERVSVHFKDGKNHKAGDPATHREGEMRVDLPDGVSLEEMKKKIPFLTDEYDGKVGQSRSERGSGYVPVTSFMCPRSEHTDYLIELISELVKNYEIDGILADYIRYHHGYTDLCTCPRCRAAFAEQYPKKVNKIMKCREWWDFREDNVVAFGKRFNDAVKAIDDQCVTGWFNLPGPSIYSRRLVAQNYQKLSNTMDSVIPMTYPYLTGTKDDGWKWGMLGNLMHWYSKGNMKRRFDEYSAIKKDVAILCVTNTVECNSEEMLKSMTAYDYGLGIALFKYFGTKEAQWETCKQYSKLLMSQKIGDVTGEIKTLKDLDKILKEKGLE